MRLSVPSLALLSILPTSLAAPAPAPAPVVAGIAPIPTPGPSTEQVQSLDERQLLNNVIPGLLPGVISLVDNLLGDVNEAVAQGNPTKVLSILSQLQPTTRPTNIEAAVARHSKIWASPTTRTDFFAAVATQIADGLVLDGTLNAALTGGLPVGENSVNNNNPPTSGIYPKKDSSTLR